jgi:hypothetical protein
LKSQIQILPSSVGQTSSIFHASLTFQADIHFREREQRVLVYIENKSLSAEKNGDSAYRYKPLKHHLSQSNSEKTDHANELAV